MDETITLLRAAQAGDREAAGRMIEANAGLIWSVARRYFGRGAEPDDLYQLGCLGFLKAISGDLHAIKREYPRDRLAIRSPEAGRIAAAFPGRTEQAENGELILKLENLAEKMDVLRRLAERFDIDEARVFEPSLNDIFAQYAGD